MTPKEMKNYLPATQAGTVRIRVRSAVFENSYGNIPSIAWQREKQILLADGSFEYVPMSPIYTQVTPELLESDINLVDVDSGEILGDIKGASIVLALQSLFVREDYVQSLEKLNETATTDE